MLTLAVRARVNAREDGDAGPLRLLDLTDNVANALAELGVARESILQVAKVDCSHVWDVSACVEVADAACPNVEKRVIATLRLGFLTIQCAFPRSNAFKSISEGLPAGSAVQRRRSLCRLRLALANELLVSSTSLLECCRQL